MDEAIRWVEQKRRQDGTWAIDAVHDEGLGFPFGETVNEPSRWITLRAMRVLAWFAETR